MHNDVGVQEYYSGSDMEYETECKCWTIYAKNYMKTVCKNIKIYILY